MNRRRWLSALLATAWLAGTAVVMPASASYASQAAAAGHKAYKAKQYRVAASHFSMAITFDATHAEYYYWASMSHSAAMEDSEAYEWIRGALSLEDGEAHYHAQHGRACLFMGMPGEAVMAYEKALARDATSGRIWADYATVLKQSGHPYQAMEALQKATQLDPSIPGLAFDLGMVVMEMGDPEGAVAPLRRATAEDPRCAECHLSLADALLASRDPRGALASYAEVLRLVPDDYRARTKSIEACFAVADQASAAAHRRALQALYDDDKVYAIGDREGYVVDRFGVGELSVQVYEYFDGKAPDSVTWSFLAYDPSGWREREVGARVPPGHEGHKKKDRAAFELIDVPDGGVPTTITSWQQMPTYPSVKTAVQALLEGTRR